MAVGAITSIAENRPGQLGAASLAQVNPFEMMNQALDLRNKMQSWNANQELSNILANSKDIPSAMDSARQSPNSAWMIPQLQGLADIQLNQARTTTETYTQGKIAADTAGLNIRNSADVIHNAIMFSGGNPDNFQAYVNQQLAGMDPRTRQAEQPYLNTVVNNTMNSVSGTDQASRNKSFQIAAYRLLIGSGMDPMNALAYISGVRPITPTIGGATVPGTQVISPEAPGQINLNDPNTGLPIIAPPTTQGTGGALGVPPQTAQAPDNRITVTPLAPPPGQAPGGVPPAPQPAPTTIGAAPGTIQQDQGPSLVPPAIQPGQAGDGLPLYIPGTPGGPTGMRGVGGIMSLSPSEQAVEDTLAKELNSEKSLSEYAGQRQTLGSLHIADQDLDALWKAGGFTTPGGGSAERIKLANSLNTAASILGVGPIFNVNNVARGEALAKELSRLQTSAVTAALGGGRESYLTLEKIGQGVPGMENTYLGNKMMIASIRASMQYAIDQRHYVNDWMNDVQTHGKTMRGAIESFNEQHPLTGYIDRELAPFGVNSAMQFKDIDSVVRDQKWGLLDKKTARQILHDQFDVPYKGAQ